MLDEEREGKLISQTSGERGREGERGERKHYQVGKGWSEGEESTARQRRHGEGQG